MSYGLAADPTREGSKFAIIDDPPHYVYRESRV
jgi:hypothetical protein